MEETSHGKIVSRYCEEHPELLTQTLAKMIYSKHPELFRNVEAVRTMIRGRRQLRSNGNNLKNYHHLAQETRSTKEWMSRYHLPSEAKKREDYIIPKANKKALLISDIHIPYHDYDALATALDYGVQQEVDTIIINGDLIDFHKISRFTNDPQARSVNYELDMVTEFFDMLRELFPTQLIVYKLGNHEARWEMFFKQKAPELWGDTYFRLQDRLNLTQWSIQFVGDLQKIKFGKLNIVHGHEFGSSFFNPVNPARGLFLRAKSNTIAGHNHQTSEHHENNLNGESMACWSTGCLCELSPEYRPFAGTKWNHGAAILSKSDDGSFTVKNFRIIKGKVH